jgi:hypothetical protein
VDTSGSSQSTPSSPPKSGAPGAAKQEDARVGLYKAQLLEVTADAPGVFEDTARDMPETVTD